MGAYKDKDNIKQNGDLPILTLNKFIQGDP